MNEPTPPEVFLAHWRNETGDPSDHPRAIKHLRDRHYEDPEPGYYKTRLRSGGPWVPVHIELVQPIDPETGLLEADEFLRAFVDGERIGQRRLEDKWLYMRPIKKTEFDALMAARGKADAFGDLMKATQAKVNLAMKAIRP